LAGAACAPPRRGVLRRHVSDAAIGNAICGRAIISQKIVITAKKRARAL
jgi:hypothetical protein